MRFRVIHETRYLYQAPASEAVSELRLFPPEDATQTVNSRSLVISPEAEPLFYTDFMGNGVEIISIPFRHKNLKVRMSADVTTHPVAEPNASADLTVAEGRRLNRDRRIALYHFLTATPLVPLGSDLRGLGYPRLRESQTLRHALLQLNHWIFTHFRYQSGTTQISTPLRDIIANRTGVCQDFAHLMLAILRSQGLPARYVSGYIEAFDPDQPHSPELIGATASHAWVEVCLPDNSWWGLDPTNDQTAGERHVKIAVGRDYLDVAPLRGTYKGALNQKLKVMVSVTRKTAKGSNAKF